MLQQGNCLMSLCDVEQLSLTPIVLEGEQGNEKVLLFPDGPGWQNKRHLVLSMAGYDIEQLLIVYE